VTAVPALEPHVLEAMRAVLAAHPEVQGAVLFGSRAKGTSRPTSDIDLALEGDLSLRALARIAGELDDLPLPLRFDVQALARIDHPELRDHIARVGIRVYARESDRAPGRRPG
jgi:predicted nucleotidyltransferase